MATLSVMTLGSPQKMSMQTTCVLLTNSPSPQKALKKDGSVATNVNAQSPNSDMLRCKRRINFSHLGYTIPHTQPAAVARRNARERNRVKQVNNGFATLRQHIPLTARNKKMSKVETLRCAVEYIKGLQQLLDENDGAILHHHAASTTTTTTTSANGAGSDQGYYSSPETVQGIADQCYAAPRGVQPLSSLSPPCSEASSPTPSYASEGSSSYAPRSVYENYENYEPMSPEDEELLDVISWWQQSQ